MGAMGGEELVEVYENFGIEPVLAFAFEFNIFFEQAIKYICLNNRHFSEVKKIA